MNYQKLQLKIRNHFLESKYTAYCKTPIGTAKIIGNSDGILSISVVDEPVEISENPHSSLTECIQQINEYFEGTRTTFQLKLNPQGTEFQKRVWDELVQIPFAKTRTYLEQSKILGNAKAIRAVAAANGKNPIWIIIPCHRIIGSDGSLTGYAGGLWRKQWLLEHENPSKQQKLF